MREHTKGPWAWRKVGSDFCLWGEYGMRPIVLDTGPLGANPTRARKPERLRLREDGIMVPFSPEHPDARLIAAAPDLLAALQEYVAGDDCDADGAPDADNSRHSETCRWCRAQSALAKVTLKKGSIP